MPMARKSSVITSYSIHYTKLYDWIYRLDRIASRLARESAAELAQEAAA